MNELSIKNHTFKNDKKKIINYRNRIKQYIILVTNWLDIKINEYYGVNILSQFNGVIEHLQKPSLDFYSWEFTKGFKTYINFLMLKKKTNN